MKSCFLKYSEAGVRHAVIFLRSSLQRKPPRLSSWFKVVGCGSPHVQMLWRLNTNPHLLCLLAILSGTVCQDVPLIHYVLKICPFFGLFFLFLSENKGVCLLFHYTLLLVMGAKVCTGNTFYTTVIIYINLYGLAYGPLKLRILVVILVQWTSQVLQLMHNTVTSSVWKC